jgi:predicted RecB family nuclease
VLTYSPFERQVIRGFARRFPGLKADLDALADRIVDLLPVIRQHFYHPGMRGSFSIKAVLPTVAPHLNYESLGEVKDGMAAQAAFEEAIPTDTPVDRRREIERSLLEYCALDTLAMVELVRFLSRPEPFGN